MSLDVVTLLYLVASVCFIQALKGLSHPTTSIRGNIFGGFLVTRRMLEMFRKKAPSGASAKANLPQGKLSEAAEAKDKPKQIEGSK